jgi:hypothetical protein
VTTPPYEYRRHVITVPMPQTPVMEITVRPAPAIEVRYPPVRVTQARDDPPASRYLPARQPPGWQPGTKRMRYWSPPPRRVTP